MEYTTIRRLELDNSQNHTQINIGDATLLASLQSLNRGRPTVILEQNTGVIAELIAELSSGTPVFSFLGNKKYRYQYASIYEKILQNAALNAEMNKAYHDAWQGAQTRLGALTIVESTIESAVKEIGKPRPVADLVTYYYPSHQYSPRFKTFELASLLLKPEGVFVVATEYKDIADSFKQWGGDFVVESGYRKRHGGQYLSAYDIAWGQKGHYVVRIQNKENKLHDNVSAIKNGIMFRAISALGMIK